MRTCVYAYEKKVTEKTHPPPPKKNKNPETNIQSNNTRGLMNNKAFLSIF